MIISYFNYLWDIDGISAGSAIKAKEFVDAIKRLGHEVHLEWRTQQPNHNDKGLRKRFLNRTKIRFQKYLREPLRLSCNIGHLMTEYKILKKQNPDIFFPRLEYDNFSCLLLSKWLNLPTVIEADCPPTHEWKAFYAKDALRFGELSMKLELALLRQADAVITQSNQLLNYYIEQGIPEEKMYMIPNAADLKKFRIRPKDPIIMAKYNLQEKVVIGWIGSGISWTGIEVLIETGRKLLKNNSNVSFLMLGSLENMDFFRNNLGANGYEDRVILPGFIPHEDIPNYLSCMDVVLAPYPQMDFFYASSMKLFEYMAAGKAILATKIGQIAEVIEDGRNGLLFDPKKPDELEQKINKLVNSEELRYRLGASARRDSETKWNWDKVGEQMVKVFEKVLEKRKVNS